MACHQDFTLLLSFKPIHATISALEGLFLNQFVGFVYMIWTDTLLARDIVTYMNFHSGMNHTLQELLSNGRGYACFLVSGTRDERESTENRHTWNHRNFFFLLRFALILAITLCCIWIHWLCYAFIVKHETNNYQWRGK